jgi:hypothetical protein
MHTGDDGHTHFSDLDVGLKIPFPNLINQPGEVFWDYVRVTGVQGAHILANAAGRDRGFHNAPRRQLVLYLTGSRELISANGDRRVIEPGDVLLAEDTTGTGHCSRSIVDPQQMVVIYIDPQINIREVLARDPNLPDPNFAEADHPQ